MSLSLLHMALAILSPTAPRRMIVIFIHGHAQKNVEPRLFARPTM